MRHETALICAVFHGRHSSSFALENHRHIRHIVRVQLLKSICLLFALAALAGCQKAPEQAQTVQPDLDSNGVPTHGQAKLPTIKLYVGPLVLDTEMALTDLQERTGMMYRTNIQDSDSMIFVLPSPQRASFWMKNCPESISCAYITADGTIKEIHHLEQNDTKPVYAAEDDIVFVLETHDGWFAQHNIPVGTVIRTEKGTLADTFLHRQ